MAAPGHGMGRRARLPGRAVEAPPLRFVPRYYEIEQALRARIAELKPDAPLPSDAMLCEEFGVSRMTARNAVQRLVQEGIVYRVPGRGTFVAEPPVHRQAGNLLSFTEEMRRRGREPSSRVLSREIREPRPSEASHLQLRPDESVIALRRLRVADDEAVAIEEAVFPAAQVALLLESADLEQRSLHDTLVHGGHVPTMGRARLGAEAAGAEDAALLGVPEGSPLLVEKRVIHDQDGRPLELCESRYAGDRYGLDVQFDVELPSDGG
jgi:GntR family transcriptional regulator